ncbi:MAG: serine--tRNA ligase [Candidatus Tyloplasma litorale]|nr:MAG: serine--tRNA ligase [Mycoplasmatales bacterium]
MIDIKKMLKNEEFFIKKFKERGYEISEDVYEITTLYNEYLSFLKAEQKLREELNSITSFIKNDPQNNKLKKEAKLISSKVKKASEESSKLNSKINKKILFFPNIQDNDVPVGKSEEDNFIISTHLDDKKNNIFSKPHWDVIEEKKLILKNEAIDISGARQVIYSDKAAYVIKALEKFMIDNANLSGYKLIEPPIIVNKKALINTGQLPKFEEDLYKLNENQYLIPTAEVPLTNLVANKIIPENELPLNYVAATNCFRKEAGSAGKDTRGLIRLHQFRKVELVTIGKPKDEKEDFERMLNTATNILEKLELPYRLVQLCTGDAGFSSKKTIDIEVWMPGTKVYREISSVSMIGDFQSRRMKTRYKDQDGNKELVNTYNGSGLAIGRTFAAIIENFINEKNEIKVPKALKKYLNFNYF